MEYANYFPHDSNARNDERIIKLRMRLGAEGYGVFFMLLEKLREESGYNLATDYEALEFELRVKKSVIKSVVEDFGLFVVTDDGRFYSPSFSKRMETKDISRRRRSEAAKKAVESRWKNDTNAIPIVYDCSTDAIQKDTNIYINKNKRKEKENIKENIKEKTTTSSKDAAAVADDYQAIVDFYFADENRQFHEPFCMQNHISLPEALRLAAEVVAGWTERCVHHSSYDDAVQHLKSTIVKKLRHRDTLPPTDQLDQFQQFANDTLRHKR